MVRVLTSESSSQSVERSYSLGPSKSVLMQIHMHATILVGFAGKSLQVVVRNLVSHNLEFASSWHSELGLGTQDDSLLLFICVNVWLGLELNEDLWF